MSLAAAALSTLVFMAPPAKVGSKRFTESYILAEIIAQQTGAKHEQGLGGTAVTFRALEDGAIDAYPEYTGTIAETITHGPADLASLRAALDPKGLAISEPIGFENTYALALNKSARGQVRTISDLGMGNPNFVWGLSHEFMGRADGWPGLSAHYNLFANNITALDHALAYEGLAAGRIDITDVYTTDAKIVRYGFVVLEDDQHFFPPYEAVILHRKGVTVPKLAIDVNTMRRLNARVELDGISAKDTAHEYLSGSRSSAGRTSLVSGIVDSIVQHGPRHLWLVLGALFLSTIAGVPLGLLAHARKRTGAAVLALTGVVQTIPSLALFCFFIPLLGIGPLPALVALFVYGLLPIVRNTHAGLASIPTDLVDSANALGLTPAQRLRHVELPLASRTILAGIKTSAVVAVGSATIAAFIGAGGFGEPISTGLALNDVPTILHGAIPAALLAIVVQGAFALLERAVVPRALR
jgi:osmoprotectant transport system permease protein